nr:hypothetical protein [uncultured Gellertiella sp.]
MSIPSLKAPNGPDINRMRTQPIAVPRTIRRQSINNLTSLPAGKMVPLAAIPVLREDAVRSGQMRISFEHMETVEVLMNAINVRVMAYFVPMLALARFNGSMDQLNLSHEGKPPIVGQPVVPYIEQIAFGAYGSNPVYKYLGLHGQPTQMVNSAYLEAYNLIWNYRAKNRSPELTLRGRLDTGLAPAFWLHDRFKHMVPDFDNASIDGQVPLNVINAKLPVKGVGLLSNPTTQLNTVVRESDASISTFQTAFLPTAPQLVLRGRAVTGNIVPDIFAELAQNGITVSLSNIELAKKTQAFARLRQELNEQDDYIIDLLMDGINIPEQAFKWPMLLADQRTIFGQSKRYASDAANLTKSVVNGMTELEIAFRVPRVGCGGVIMLVAEITPDQLFERQEDPFFAAGNVNDLPQYLRDELDPEKVDIVQNKRIDSSHGTPAGTFAYEPMNARWNMDQPRIGGQFYRPQVNTAFDEDRQRIWASEVLNPTLSSEFYICTNIHTKPFVVTNRDPFECVTQGDVFVEGNTVFGGHLIEATDDYNRVYAVAPQTRLA